MTTNIKQKRISCPFCKGAGTVIQWNADIEKEEDASGGARASDPETSQESALKTNVTKLEFLVLRNLEIDGPGTMQEIALRMGYFTDNIGPRLSVLERKGEVIRNGTKINSLSGRPAILWSRFVANE